MSVAVGKLEGVASVHVSLNEGTADVTLEPGNTLDPERIREAVRDNGFDPKGAEVRVRGRLIRDGGGLVLSVAGPDVAYPLAAHPEATRVLDDIEGLGHVVAVSGHLPEAEPGERPILLVRGVEGERP